MAFSSIDSTRRLMSQYNLKVVETEKINADLSCTICRKLMIDSYQTYCGCSYCRTCIVSYLQYGDKYCDGGKEECKEEHLVLDMNVAASPQLNKKILKVKVHCPNVSCPYITELVRMEEHLSECTQQTMGCPFSIIGCDANVASKNGILDHLYYDNLAHSQLLIELIHHLKNEMNAMKEDFSMSKEEMNAMKIEMMVVREELRVKDIQIDDLRRDMNNQETDVTNRNREIIKEIEDQTRSRNIETEREIENQKKETNDLQMQIEYLKEGSKKRKVIVEDVKKELTTLKKEIVEERECSRNIKNTAETSEKESKKYQNETRLTLTKTKEKIEWCETMIEDLKEMIESRNVINSVNFAERSEKESKKNRSDSKRKSAPAMARSKSYMHTNVDVVKEMIAKKEDAHAIVALFTVDKISVRKTVEEEMLSPYFYSHTNGYKLRLSVHPGGRGDSRGTHLSAFFIICKGEYDDILPWPCKHTFTLSITDKSYGVILASQTYSYAIVKEEHKNSFDKPINKDNLGLGSPKLVSHEDLRSDAGLVVNDSVIVKCVVSAPAP